MDDSSGATQTSTLLTYLDLHFLHILNVSTVNTEKYKMLTLQVGNILNVHGG